MKLTSLLFLSLFSLQIQAYTLVTDLDDTLKITNVLDASDALRNALFSKKAFSGMPEVLNALEEESNGLYILSASPNLLNFRIKRFLNFNEVNYHSFFTRRVTQLGDKEKYKLDVLKSVSEVDNDELILFGDNAEIDGEIYLKFKEQQPQSVARIYIHDITHNPKLENIVYFYTAFDIALNEYLLGNLSFAQANSIGSKILLEKDLNLIIPDFAYCPTKNADFNKTPLSALSLTQAAVQTKIIGFCRLRQSAIQ